MKVFSLGRGGVHLLDEAEGTDGTRHGDAGVPGGYHRNIQVDLAEHPGRFSGTSR